MSFLPVSTIEDQFTLYRGNLGGAGNSEFLQWINWLQETTYPKLYATNPNDYLTNRYYKTIADLEQYALPSGLETIQVGGIYRVDTSGSAYQALNYDTQTVQWTIGTTVTGQTSGATGTLIYDTDYGTRGTLIMNNVDGTFEDNESIKGLAAGAQGTAKVDGTGVDFQHSDEKITETDLGSQSFGFWLDQTYLYFTPIPTLIDVYLLRYIPRLTPLTGTSDSTIFTDKYKEFVTYAMETYWAAWRQNQNTEFLAGQRYRGAILDYLDTVKKTPRVMRLRDRSGQIYSEGGAYSRTRTIIN